MTASTKHGRVIFHFDAVVELACTAAPQLPWPFSVRPDALLLPAGSGIGFNRRRQHRAAGICGGGFSSVSATHYGCSTARNKGTCSNRLVIRRDVLEASVLDGLKQHLMEPELVKEFI